MKKKNLNVALRQFENSLETILDAAKKYNELNKLLKKQNKKIHGEIDYDMNPSNSDFLKSLEDQAFDEQFGEETA